MAVPWNGNINSFKDLNIGTGCPMADISNFSCSAINTKVNYPIESITPLVIPTHQPVDPNQPPVDSIGNIKAVLLNNQGVYLSYFLPTQMDWDSFVYFWNNENESLVYPGGDPACGVTVQKPGRGWHGLLVVGFDETDPDINNHYWIVLNSWSTVKKTKTTRGSRPHGLFRMKMHIDYDCQCPNTIAGEPSAFYTTEWYTYNVTFAPKQKK